MGNLPCLNGTQDHHNLQHGKVEGAQHQVPSTHTLFSYSKKILNALVQSFPPHYSKSRKAINCMGRWLLGSVWDLAAPPLRGWSWLDGPVSKNNKKKKKIETFPTFPLPCGEKSFSRVTAEDNSKITAKLFLISPLSQITCNSSPASLLGANTWAPGWAQEALGFPSLWLCWPQVGPLCGGSPDRGNPLGAVLC